MIQDETQCMYIILSLSLSNKHTFVKQSFKKQRSHWGLTGDNERGGAAVGAVFIGSLAGEFTAVGFDGIQQLQRGTGVEADDPILLTLSDLRARFVPFEGHIWSIFNLTIELGLTADVDLHRCDFLPENRWH